MLNLNRENSVIFGLSTSKELAKDISEITGIKLGVMTTKRFADEEIFVESQDSIRNKSVFVIQSTHKPANDNLMELLLVIDALKRSSVGEVNVIIPYFGYARQDRKVLGRQAISAKLVANLLTTAGADRIITFDIHSEQIVGFFDIPVDNLKAYGLTASAINMMNIEDLTIVSPDHGGVSRARSLAQMLNAPLAVVDKRRTDHNQAEAMFILGDVKDRNIIIYDDMVDTGGTVAEAAKILLDNGAKDVYLAVTHGVLSTKADGTKATDTLRNAGIKAIITTNSINNDEDDFIKQIDLAEVLAGTISNHIDSKSITDHFITKYNTNL